MPEFAGGDTWEASTHRINEIAKILSKGEYDLYLYQELWIEYHYNFIRPARPSGYYITDFNEKASYCVFRWSSQPPFRESWYSK